MNKIKSDLEYQSVLNFTYELNQNGKLPFVDILIEESNEQYKTNLFRKPTDAGRCVNYDGQCPERYKMSAVQSYIRRANKICTDENELRNEINNIKQILVNNGFSNKIVDDEIRKL